MPIQKFADLPEDEKQIIFKLEKILPDPSVLPIWIFDEQATFEIRQFWNSLSNDEMLSILDVVKIPTFSRVKIKKLVFVVYDRRPFEPDISAGKRIAGMLHDADLDALQQDHSILANYARVCVVCRSWFADRYVEVLTKHQKRHLQRGGTLRPNEPRLIKIAWDAPTPRYRATQASVPTISDNTPHDPVKRCEHEVKGHKRHLKSGRDVWVREHKRGSKDVPRKTQYHFTGSKHDAP